MRSRAQTSTSSKRAGELRGISVITFRRHANQKDSLGFIPLSGLYPEDFHRLVAEVVDYLDGYAARLRLGEGAGD